MPKKHTGICIKHFTEGRWQFSLQSRSYFFDIIILIMWMWLCFNTVSCCVEHEKSNKQACIEKAKIDNTIQIKGNTLDT